MLARRPVARPHLRARAIALAARAPLALYGIILAVVLLLLAVPARAQSDTGVMAAPARSEGSLRNGIPLRPRGRDYRGWQRSSVERIDDALAQVKKDWDRLSSREQGALLETFRQLLPSERPSRYVMNDAQARALVWLAFGEREEWGRGDRDACSMPGRRCAGVMQEVSDAAERIHESIEPIRRSSSRSLSRDEEARILRDVAEGARKIMISTSGCGCTAARASAEALLDAARDAQERHRRSVVSAWMAVGDARLAELQSLARQTEKDALRCGDVRGR